MSFKAPDNISMITNKLNLESVDLISFKRDYLLYGS
jgi:hypothetical protein